jgi:SAM-dependent methyltransferase
MFWFSLTTLLSSFLLFLVQPMIARMILPWFGGSAAVWATCVVFFQITLLAGYLYAHEIVRRLSLARQRWLHGILLAAALAFLPIIPGVQWKPLGGQEPSLLILGLLATTIGLPYLLLSTTGPLLQAWYVQYRPGSIPYRLFALSNLGSMLALLSYPTLLEPRMTLTRQSFSWSSGFVLFALLCGFTGFLSIRKRGMHSPDTAHVDGEEPVLTPPPAWIRWDWVLYAMCPSILLLALTNHLTQDVAAIPFLWVIPLGLYLLSFILCFDSDRWYRRWLFWPLLWAALFALAFLTLSEIWALPSMPLVVESVSASYFVVCMFCHGELARRRPHPQYLTLFFLLISLGGALGGFLVALVAPNVFNFNYELPIGLGLCVYLIVQSASVEAAATPGRRSWTKLVSIGLGMLFFLYLGLLLNRTFKDLVLAARNFYGEIRVTQTGEAEDWLGVRVLLNGSIDHGEEFLHPKRRAEPTTYYCPSSGVGMVMETRPPERPERVGVIGLGAGTLLSYSRRGDYYRVYDINPLVVRVARTQFGFIEGAQGQVDIVLGDARLSLEREPPQNFDLLVVDAFSSDSIPVHLLTQEAIQLYFRNLKADGVLAIHVSNRHVELEPVLEQQGLRAEKLSLTVDDHGDLSRRCFETVWVLMTARRDLFARPEFEGKGRPPKVSVTLPLWTDDYSNVFQLLK